MLPDGMRRTRRRAVERPSDRTGDDVQRQNGAASLFASRSHPRGRREKVWFPCLRGTSSVFNSLVETALKGRRHDREPERLFAFADADLRAPPRRGLVGWHAGLRLPVSTWCAIFAGEAYIHGWDIARALRRPWRHPPARRPSPPAPSWRSTTAGFHLGTGRAADRLPYLRRPRRPPAGHLRAFRTAPPHAARRAHRRRPQALVGPAAATAVPQAMS
jgi:hypothetical protein